jgi:hypothetical protein
MILGPRMLALGACSLLLAATSACGGSSHSSAGGAGTSLTPSSQSTPTATTTPPPAQHSRTPTKHTPQSNPPATEFNPPGDIPDNQVFVTYHSPGSNLEIKVPEGWARRSTSGVTTFTDNYNSVGIQVIPTAKPPTVASAQATEVPALRNTVAKYSHGQVAMVQRQHGSAVLITYFADSEPNPVTGKVVRDVVQRFEFWHNGQEAVLTLTGPQGADNVDPWQLVSDSVQWQ